MDIERRMRERGFGEALIARVVRLNPNPVPGQKLRGLNLSRNRDEAVYRDLISKGACIRRRGRTWFEGVPNSLHVKCGKRVYIAPLIVTGIGV